VGIGYGVMGGQTHNDSTHEQAKTRRYVRKLDQHGRKWGMTVDMRTGRHCSVIEYLGHPQYKGLTPRILPPQTHLKYLTEPPKDNPDMFIENYIRVDYEGWKAEIKQGWADFTKQVHEEYAKRNIQCDWTPSNGVHMRPDVREIVGPDPSPLQVVLACEQGNKWALYGVGSMPKGLTPFFGAERRNRSALEEIERTFDARDTDGIVLEGEAEDDPELERAIALEEEYDIPVKVRATPAAGSWAEFRTAGLAKGQSIKEISAEWRALKATTAVG